MNVDEHHEESRVEAGSPVTIAAGSVHVRYDGGIGSSRGVIFSVFSDPGPRLLVGVGGGSGCGGYSRTVTELEFHTVSFISYIQLYSDTASSAPLLVCFVSPPLSSYLMVVGRIYS